VQILVASDLHYTLPQLDWILAQAPQFDAVVLAGDHLDLSSSVPLESQIVVIRTYLEKMTAVTDVIACSGNHDLTARNFHEEKSAPWIETADQVGAHVDWGRLDRGDVRVTICPWWDGPATRADVDAQFDKDAVDRPPVWIWIYHHPPDESPISWIGKRHVGDKDLNGWIDKHQPDLVLTGHIHDSPFKEGGDWVGRIGVTWVMNAGRQMGPLPAHVVVDTEAGTAEWFSFERQGTKQLWPPRVPAGA
jgi:Icc-related predicted phosphoesterase